MNNLLNNRIFVLFLAPFILGALSILSFAPFNLTFINFFTFSGFLFLILEIKKNNIFNIKNKIHKKQFFYLGCSFGFSFFLFGNYWIAIALTHDDEFRNLIPISLTVIPFFLSIFWGIAVLIIGPFAQKNIFYILLFSLFFSLFEFLRGNLMTGFPWNLISYTWSWSTESIQILSIIGTYALSLISITFFCTPILFFQKQIIKKNIIFLFILIFVFILNYLFGISKINNNYKFDEKITVKIVSPNFSLFDYKNQSEETQLKELIKLSKPEKNKKTLFIWPEGIFYESYLEDIKQYQDLFELKFSRNHLIILGAISSITSGDKNKKEYFNSMVVLNNKLDILSTYNKINLVPFGEFLPFEFFLSKFGLKKITRGYNSFSSGNDRKIINIGKDFSNKLILPLICYEIIYTGKIKKNNQLPDLLVNISEDAWFGKSIGPFQHFTKAIYRSVEEGVFVARSANKGISAFINPNGKVIKSLNKGESGDIELNFPTFYEKTLFSNYGNKIFYLIIFLYMFLILTFKKFKI